MKKTIPFILFIVSAQIAAAQQPVTPEEAAAQAVQSQFAREISKLNTGVPGSASPEAASSTNRDFVSALLAAFESAQDGKPVTLAYNVPVGKRKPIQIETVFTQPDLAANVIAQLKATNSTAADALKKQLGYSDDVMATITWNNTEKNDQTQAGGKTAGADFMRTLTNSARRSAQLRREQAAAMLPTDAVGAQSLAMADLFATQPGLAEVATRDAASQADLLQRMLVRGLAQSSDAAPQWYVSGSYHWRTSLAGASEWMVKATWETGKKDETPAGVVKQAAAKTQQLSAARAQLSATSAGQAAALPLDTDAQTALKIGSALGLLPTTVRLSAANTLTAEQAATAEPDMTQLLALTQFLKNATTTTPASRNTRFAFSAEAHRTLASDVIETDPALTLHTSHSHSFVGRISAGSNVYNASVPDHTGRLELALAYEDVTGDPTKNDRFVGSLTYTQKIGEKSSFPIALIYANKDQYLGDVRKKLNVHFGISYKLPDLKQLIGQP